MTFILAEKERFYVLHEITLFMLQVNHQWRGEERPSSYKYVLFPYQTATGSYDHETKDTLSIYFSLLKLPESLSLSDHKDSE